LPSQLDPRDVAEARDARTLRLHYDVLELLDVGQAAERVHGELKVLGVRRRGLTELAGGHLDVLLANGGHHVAGGEAARLEALRIEPHAHAVLPRAEDVHVAHAVDARDLITETERGVVAEVEVVVAAVGRGQDDE
jgi:hypothetical protein